MNLRFALALVTTFLVATTALAQVPELDTPYVPTPEGVVENMLELAQLKPGDTIIDLGSGDGRIVITAAREHGAHGFGVEIDPQLVDLSSANARRAGVADRARFIRQDLFETDLRPADVLTLYLLPDVNLKLRPKILAELAPGARVVSHDYDMGEWRPDAERTVAAPDKPVGAHKESTIYLWIVPAKVEGVWSLRIGDRPQPVPLALEQRFQFVSGSVPVPGAGKVPIPDGRLRGEELRLTLPGGVYGLEPLELVGRLSGDALSGSARRGERDVVTWSAQRSR